jgi:hypothetical protein
MGFYSSAFIIFHLFISPAVYTLQKRHFEKHLGETIHPLPIFSQTARCSKIISTRQSTHFSFSQLCVSKFFPIKAHSLSRSGKFNIFSRNMPVLFYYYCFINRNTKTVSSKQCTCLAFRNSAHQKFLATQLWTATTGFGILMKRQVDQN